MRYDHGLILLAALSAGIITGYSVDNILYALIPLISAIAVGLSGGRLRAAFPSLLFFGLGWIAISLRMPAYTGAPEPTIITSDNTTDQKAHIKVIVAGVVDNSVSTTRGERSKIKIKTISNSSGVTVCHNVYAVLFSSAAVKLTPGDVISARCNISPANDSHDNTRWLCFSYGERDVAVTGYELSLNSWSASVREYLSSCIDKTPLQPFTKSFAKAVMIGDKTSLSKDLKSGFADAGISHMLAVSGLHVGIVSMLILWLFTPIVLMRNGFMLRFIITIIFIWIYVLLTGMSLSSVRAALMISVTITALATSRLRNGFQAVCVAAVFILFFDPLSLWDAGLQLSFVCVSALCLFVKRLNVIDQSAHPHTHKLFGMVLTTLVATFATFLLSAYYYGTLPLQFLSANIVALPLLPLFISAAAIYFLIALFVTPPLYVTAIVDLYPNLLQYLIDNLSPFAIHMEVGIMPVILWLSGLYAVAFAINGRKAPLPLNTAIKFTRYRIIKPILLTGILSMSLALYLTFV